MEQSRAYVTATALGAKIHTEFVAGKKDDANRTTHVVAARPGTKQLSVVMRAGTKQLPVMMGAQYCVVLF